MPRSFRLISRCLVVLVIALVVPLVGAGEAGAGAAEDEVALFQLTNQSRAQAGQPAMSRDGAADLLARGWSARMAQGNTLSHNPNLAAEVGATVTTQWTRIGENVGVGYDAASLHNAFMNSSGHRANVLGDYNRVGVGAVRGGDGRLWVTLVFVKGPAVAPPPVPASNFRPFGDADAFVRQQYVDILGRPADAVGHYHWTTLLMTGAAGTGDVGATFIASPEFGGVVAPITRLYFAALHRVPDPVGLQHWVAQVRAGVSIVDVARAFAASPEFRSATIATTSQDFVRLVYSNVLGRAADAGGLGYWTALLDTGRLDRGQVLLQFAESGEFVYATRFGVTTAIAYVALLCRPADTAGMEYWVEQFWRGTSPAVLLGAFYKSAEYNARF